jgi:mannose-6-phosphate isomerase-like protein (cupin superfamily)
MTNAVTPALTFTIGMTGERFEYLSSAHEGDGHFRFRWTLAPGKKGPPEHVHSDERETFLVESGRLQVWVDDVHHALGPGDSVTVPVRGRHRFKNEGPDPVVVLVTFDGTRNEEAHVPVAAHFAGGRKMGVVDVLRIFVHDAEVGGSLASFEPLNALQRAIAAVMRRFGVRRFPPVRGWARPAATPPSA